MHIKCGRGYTRAGGERCLPEIVFIPAHKERYETGGGGAAASRKFKVTKKYGGITRNRNAETNERAFLFAGKILRLACAERASFLQPANSLNILRVVSLLPGKKI